MEWTWSPLVAALFGLDYHAAPADFEDWYRTVFVDDAPKIRSALETAKQSGAFHVEFRVRQADGRLRWVAGRGRVSLREDSSGQVLHGTYYDIDERKQLQARLLS